MNWQNVLNGSVRWSVDCADNADVLPAMPPKSVGHVIADPPYDTKTHAGARTTDATGAGMDAGIDFAPLSSLSFVPQLLTVSARWVLAFCALEQLGPYAEAAGDAWIRSGIWDRIGSMPQITGDRPAQGAEGVAIMHRGGRKAWNGGGKKALWSFLTERNDRAHPTQKPLPLMLELVELFTDPEDIVLDPFCGSGTTGVACLRLGRRFIGIEKSPEYAAVARERLEAESKGLTLRAARAGQGSLFGGAL